MISNQSFEHVDSDAALVHDELHPPPVDQEEQHHDADPLSSEEEIVYDDEVSVDPAPVDDSFLMEHLEEVIDNDWTQTVTKLYFHIPPQLSYLYTLGFCLKILHYAPYRSTRFPCADSIIFLDKKPINTNLTNLFLVKKQIPFFIPSFCSSINIIPNLIFLGCIIINFSCLVNILALVVSAWTHYCTLVIVILFKSFQYLLGPRWRSFNMRTDNHYGCIKNVHRGAEPTKRKKETENLLHSSSMILLIPLRGNICHLIYFMDLYIHIIKEYGENNLLEF